MNNSITIERAVHVTEPLLESAARWSLAWLVIVLLLPGLLAGAGFRYLLIPLVYAGVLAALAGAEEPSARPTIFCFGVIGFALSIAFLLGAQWLQHSAGFIVLGPDGILFLDAAQQIVRQRFALPQRSFEYFGTYGTGHYFVFAGLIYSLGSTLFSLQVFNCAAAALIGPFTFAWTRALYPRGALAAGLLVTLFPSVVYLAAVDLWRDSSVILATTVAIWAMVHIANDGRPRRLVPFALVAGGCFFYLHLSRFYPLAYLELGLLFAAVLAIVRRRTIAKPAVAAIVLAVAIGEGGPIALGWPTSPRMFITAVAHTMTTPAMKYFTAGLLDRVALDSTEALGDRPRHKLQTVDFQVGLMAPVDAAASQGEGRLPAGRARGPSVSGATSVLQTDIETSLSTPATFGSISWAMQIVRRLYGPFVWIMPPTLDARGWLAGLYLMYPGMLFWYALFPLMLAGYLVAGWNIVRGKEQLMMAVVWVYAGIYSLQFLAINLPARHREAMFPVLATFAVMGYHAIKETRWWRPLYSLYWLALIGMAVAHLYVRSQMAR